MKNLLEIILASFFLCILGLSGQLINSVHAADLSGMSKADLVEIGRRIYQAGEMANGDPVKAFVLGDVEVTGTQFYCMNCHRRSGLGGQEGTEFVLPTNGASIFTPRVDVYMGRPAYSLQSFTDAMTAGINPVGAEFDQIMPRYELPDLEVQALFAYLKTLSSDYSPGVTEDELHIATVVGPDVTPRHKGEMLAVIRTFFKNKNATTRNEVRRRQSGPFFHEYRNQAYRKWVHHVWELSGPTENWPAQLENYYRQQPVFAMLSGMVTGAWKPVHDFCRARRIPCILPNTDLPDIEKPVDFYTLYFSKGLMLEAQVLAADIAARGNVKKVLQVVQSEGDGTIAAQNLLEGLRTKAIEGDIVRFDAKNQNKQKFQEQLRRISPQVVVLWLDEAALKKFPLTSDSAFVGMPVYISSSLMGGSLDLVPAGLAEYGRVVFPFILPQDQEGRFRLVSSWLKKNRLPLTNRRVQGQTHYACLLLNAGMNHIKKYFYREYLLDTLDHGDKMAAYSGNYPRLSFGPEQRFLAKGAYVVDLKTGMNRWVVPGH